MVQQQNMLSVHVIWKGRKFSLELNSYASLKELGDELRLLTDVKADTMKLIIPQSSTKSSKLFMPFSDEHSWIRLQDTGIAEGKPLRMMGVYEHEVDQLLKDAKANLRIAGFEDEEKRMKQRISGRPQVSHKLPQGPYIFCDFRTLELPGLQLNPPPLEALKRMHMLASDPGIVAIMNKHRWRVGIMTEMAPVGYVGISPRCLLGFNKNGGEEISLRLRTDDLKGFRKYESIKKTLLHELAHMVFSDHDSKFYALDRQLNKEAFALDWTRSRGHTLTDTRYSGHDNLDMEFESESSLPQKLGGATSHMAIAAREASVAAAYHRLEDSSINFEGSSAYKEKDSDDNTSKSQSITLNSDKEEVLTWNEHDEANEGITQARRVKLGTGNFETRVTVPKLASNEEFEFGTTQDEPDPDDSEISESKVAVEPRALDTQAMQIDTNTINMLKATDEPDPDDFEARTGNQQVTMVHSEPDPDDAQENRMQRAEPDPDDRLDSLPKIPMAMTDEPDPDDEELKRIQDPVNVFCKQLGNAIHKLLSDFRPSESKVVLETLFKIIRNASQNPTEMKYKKLRKANPILQRNIVSYKAAMEVLFMIGFSEDTETETGKSETYLVLKRDDPALLWLAKSTLESYISL